ncbi:MAG TPA: AI-2E family transporter [Polyangiaceae bacterium]|nr:AI-2E family transporter [Polyangiaceae bacterium]
MESRAHPSSPFSASPSPPPSAPDPESQREPGITWRRTWIALGVAFAVVLAYLLRGVIVPLFFAFLLAYALDPFVDRLEALRVPRTLGAMLVMVGILTLIILAFIYAIPLLLDELRAAAQDLPSEVEGLQGRLEPWIWSTFKLKMPHSLSEVGHTFGDRIEKQGPGLLSALALALFGTLSYVAVALSALIVPVFALYLLIDFDRIVARAGQLVPRRWTAPVNDVAVQVHHTLGGYVRGQLTANFVLGALYATGLRIVDIRLAVPIGVMTGMLAFVPYIGFFTGLFTALAMATLDWHGPGRLLGVLAVMGGVQLLDGLFITPRIVGRSVGLAPLEVLITMMAAASLFGFLGVLLAVPLGAVVKILIQRVVKVYLTSEFYGRS